MTIRTGLARFPETNFKTSTYCVAYLDILGAKNKIYKDKNCDFLNHLNMFFQDALDEKQYLFKEYKNEIFTKIFSDNILYAIKIEENDTKIIDKITALLILISNLYNEIFIYGHLMRGAIVIGNFFQNKNIVYGPALVEAVHIEEKIAKNPRIIVQKEIMDLVPYYCLQDSKDDLYFLNIFNCCNPFEHISFKINLLNMLKQNQYDEKIKDKVLWMINYFNKWFAQDVRFFINKPQITAEEIQFNSI